MSKVLSVKVEFGSTLPRCSEFCEADGANRLGPGGHRYQCWTAPAPAKNADYSQEMD